MIALAMVLAVAAGQADDAVHYDAGKAQNAEMRRGMVMQLYTCSLEVTRTRMQLGDTSKAKIVKTVQDQCLHYSEYLANMVGMPPRAKLAEMMEGDVLREIARVEAENR